jgi:hypothetical protein
VRVPGRLSLCMVCARVALLMQHATRLRHVVRSFVGPLAPPHFSTLFHKRYDFLGGGGGGKRFSIKCVSILSTTLSKVFLILVRIQ